MRGEHVQSLVEIDPDFLYRAGLQLLQMLPILHHQRSAPERRVIPSRSEEHTSELQSLMRISYAVFCLKKKTHTLTTYNQLKKLSNKHTNTHQHTTNNSKQLTR